MENNRGKSTDPFKAWQLLIRRWETANAAYHKAIESQAGGLESDPQLVTQAAEALENVKAQINELIAEVSRLRKPEKDSLVVGILERPDTDTAREVAKKRKPRK